MSDESLPTARRRPVPPPGLVGHPLELGEDGGGPRHFIDGEPVHAGASVWLALEGGWVIGRYEGLWPHGSGGQLVGLCYIGLAGGHEAPVTLPPGARLAFYRRPVGGWRG